MTAIKLLTDQALADYQRLRESGGSYPLDGESLYHLTGEDVASWLQGQITQDVSRLEIGKGCRFCLCTPTGQILALGRTWRVEDGFLVVIPQSAETVFESRLSLTVILEDVIALKCKHLLGTAVVASTAPIAQDGWVVRSNRNGLACWSVWTSRPFQAPSIVCESAWELIRIESGEPQFGVDFTGRTLPPELGPHIESQTISYTKGCYTGQEIMMRIYSRGHTNRVMRGLLCRSEVEPAAVVSHELRADAGVVGSVAVSPQFGPIALAQLRTESAVPGEIVSVRVNDREVEAEVVELPFFRRAE